MTTRIVWLSLDPVRCKVDLYSPTCARLIEAAYADGKADEVELGGNCFDATVRFQRENNRVVAFQTTPPFQGFRGDYKPPGYRTVRRMHWNGNGALTVHAKRVHGEWRLCDGEDEAERSLTVVPESTCDLFLETARTWTQADVDLKSSTPLIAWQWSLTTGFSASSKDESDWVCYPESINNEIERAHAASETPVGFRLGMRRMEVVLNGSCFATQRDTERWRARLVRRVVTDSARLAAQLDAASKTNFAALQRDFCCPITQQRFTDPVLTCDGHTYERSAIETWLQDHLTSPLTGLNLASQTLVSNKEIVRLMEAE